jgi:signal transduction histidine kinase
MLEEDLPNMEFDQIKHIVSVLRNSAFGAYSLLENLLEWSRMKRGITNFSPEQFLLQSNIEVSLQSVMELARKKWIEVSINIPEELQAFADPNMLGSIIRNLTTNAIKFTPKYGTVLISAQVNDDQNIEISVKDSGIGMNQNILSKLFSNDELTNRRGTDGESSSGLGLIICKDFVEKHGGKIWAKSEVGKGSTLYFTLPHPMNV